MQKLKSLERRELPAGRWRGVPAVLASLETTSNKINPIYKFSLKGLQLPPGQAGALGLEAAGGREAGSWALRLW